MRGEPKHFDEMGESVAAIEYHLNISPCSACAGLCAEELAGVCHALGQSLEPSDFASSLLYMLSVQHLDHLHSQLQNTLDRHGLHQIALDAVKYLNRLMDMIADESRGVAE